VDDVVMPASEKPAQEETWRARLDYEWVATVEVLRGVADERRP